MKEPWELGNRELEGLTRKPEGPAILKSLLEGQRWAVRTGRRPRAGKEEGPQMGSRWGAAGGRQETDEAWMGRKRRTR